MIPLTPHIAVAEDELQWQFVRASGPGGQNVNKVATAAQLRFDVRRSPSLPDDVRNRLARLAGRRMSTDGVLIIDARRFRTQERNRQDALERLADLVLKAEETPRPRRKTRPTLASRERRLEGKRKRAAVKRARGVPDSEA
jgi:ribosome-associated protein